MWHILAYIFLNRLRGFFKINLLKCFQTEHAMIKQIVLVID